MLDQLEQHDRITSRPSKSIGRNALHPKVHTDQDDGLLATAGPIMIAAYAVSLTAAALSFKGAGEALFAVAISSGFAVMFFTMPLLMMHIRARHDSRWQARKPGFRSGEVDTFTGRVGRSEAVLHIVIVPLAACLAFIAFAVIWALVRP